MEYKWHFYTHQIGIFDSNDPHCPSHLRWIKDKTNILTKQSQSDNKLPKIETQEYFKIKLLFVSSEKC